MQIGSKNPRAAWLVFATFLACANGAIATFETVATYDTTANSNQVDFTANPGTALNLPGPASDYVIGSGMAAGSDAEFADFVAAVAAQHALGFGGVIPFDDSFSDNQDNFDDGNVVGVYGLSDEKTITLVEDLINDREYVQSSQTTSRTPISGGNHLFPGKGDGNNMNNQNENDLWFNGVTLGGTLGSGERLTQLGFTILSRDYSPESFGDLGDGVVATVTFSGGGTVTATRQMDGPAGSEDTFFGFVAPPGQFIVDLDVELPQLNGGGVFFSGMDDLAFITEEAGPLYQQWAASNITAIDGSADASFEGNADADPFANGLEWILAGNPLAFESTDVLLLPDADAATGLTLEFFRNKEAVGLATLEVEFSNDLFDSDLHVAAVPNAAGVTTVNGVEFTVTDVGGGVDSVVAVVPASAADPEGKLFVRLAAVDLIGP